MKPKPVTKEKVVFVAAALLLVLLALKALKEFIVLSFTLLSLKIVWVLLIVLAFLTMAKKRT